MEVAVDGGGSNGVFAAAIVANDGMVVTAATIAAYLMMTTAIAAATIGRRRHCPGCHCVIAVAVGLSQQHQSASSTVATVDGGGDNGIFTTASHDDYRHPHPHCPCPPLDKNWTAGWRVHRDASHSLLPRLSLLAPSLSPLAG
jgi:hypothetical protein